MQVKHFRNKMTKMTEKQQQKTAEFHKAWWFFRPPHTELCLCPVELPQVKTELDVQGPLNF